MIDSMTQPDSHIGPPRSDAVVLPVCVLNEQGLHARPAAVLAREAQKFASEIKVSLNGEVVDAKSILDLLTLAAGHGATLEIRADGPDAGDAAAHLARLFQARFR